MLIYLGTFAVSIGLAAYGEALSKKENKRGFVGCLVLAVLVVVLLASLRDVPVGTDGVAYQRWIRDAAKCSSFIKACAVGRETEPLFMAFVYAIAKTVGDVHVLFFIVALLTYGLFMAGVVQLQAYLSIPYAWAAYLFLFFGNSLNQLRQAMAMTAVVLAFTLIRKRKYLAGAVLVVLAALCHNVTLPMAVIIFGIYAWMKKWNTWQFKTVLLAGTAFAVFFYKPLFLALNELKIIPDRFIGYVTHASVMNFSLNPILVRLPFVVLMLVFYRDFSQQKEQEGDTFTKAEADFLLVMIGMELILSELRTFGEPLYRLCRYFGVFRCLGIGRLVAGLKESPKNQKWAKPVMALLLAMLVVIWLYQVVLQGNDEIYPYTSELLHISADTFF